MRMGTENKILISLAGVLCPSNPCWSNYGMTLYSTEYQRGLDDLQRYTHAFDFPQRISVVRQFCFTASDKDIMFNRRFPYFINKTCL